MSWDLPEPSAPEAKPKPKARKKAKDKDLSHQFAEAFEKKAENGLACLDLISSENPSQLAKADSNKQNELTAIAHAGAWVEGFLTSLARHGTILAASREADVTRARVYQLIDDSPTFAKAVEVAKAEFAELLEQVAIQRAMNGSERLLEFLLKGALPSKYRENAQAVQVNVGQPIIVDVIESQPIDAQVVDQS